MNNDEFDRRLEAMFSFSLAELNQFELNARSVPSVQLVCDLAAFALGVLKAAEEDGQRNELVELYKATKMSRMH